LLRSSSHRFDVIKSRIQSSTAQGKAQSIMGVAKELVAAEGFGALYKGLAPALIRAVPANAACFVGIESSRKLLDQLLQ
jgi:solute carrier family 25 carnitine/acylcarnitine transporter 20/29